jgi:hypothetical protein
MVARSTLTALVGAFMLSGVANAVGPMGQRGRNLAELFREQYTSGMGGVNLYPPERNEVEFSIMASNHTNSTLTKNYVELPIDHFSDCSDTYQNRYWVQEQYYKPGGPVFIYDGGESNAAPSVSWMRGPTFFTDMLKEFGGMGIVWEHRYYGQSIPEPRNDRTFLTVEQALADIPAMAAKFSRPNFPHVDLTPAGTPWVFVGASYPGVRAAMSREKYPETFHASWAASAPVQARADMSAYWSPIIPGMKAFGLGGCLADIQAANEHMEGLLANNATAAPLKSKFFGKDAATMSDHDFAYSLAAMFFSWQSSLASGGIGNFCDRLESDTQSNKTAPAEGWAPTRGAAYVVNRLAESGEFSRVPANFRQYDDMSWMWQYCTQFGFLQGSGPELDHLIIKYNSVAWQEELCRRAFPGEVTAWPDTKDLNTEFGGWTMRPSNVFWTNGEFDPWRTLSPLSGLAHAPDVEATTEVPACGCSTSQDEIFGGILPKSAHGYEFGNSDSAKEMQKLWTKALKTWLPCFQRKPHSTLYNHTPAKCTGYKTQRAAKLPMMNTKRSVAFTA